MVSNEQKASATQADDGTSLFTSGTVDHAILFGDFRLVPTTRTLTKGDVRIQLGGRALDILIALVERAGKIVSKTELFAIVWQNSFVEESNLRVHIAQLRKALGDDLSGTKFIMSVPRRGYAFIAQTKWINTSAMGLEGSDIASDPDCAPVPLVKIVDRDEIVSDIASALGHARLVTITGVGGIGKSAVALAVAQKIRSSFRNGVLLVDLALLASPELVTSQLATVLRLPDPDSRPLQSVVTYLRTRSMLIVLDNCEHLIEAASGTAEAIRQGAPEVHILATSREPLRAMGERIQRLGPLAMPSASAKVTVPEALRYPAVQLFVERALATDATFELTDIDAPVIGQICARLDGLPFAIEMAATRVRVFGLRGLADRLDDRFNILTSGHRSALPRHRTLRALIDWSYEPLSHGEKFVWRRLGLFPGSFTLEAVDAIVNDRSSPDFNVAEILGCLVEKSLVSVEMSGNEIRYRLIETLRLYAVNKLLEANEIELVRQSRDSNLHEYSVRPKPSACERAIDLLPRHQVTANLISVLT